MSARNRIAPRPSGQSRGGAFRVMHPLRRGGIFPEQPLGPHGPWLEITATVRAGTLEARLCAIGAVGAFEGADHGGGRIRRKIPVAALAVGSHLEHGILLTVSIPRRGCSSGQER